MGGPGSGKPRQPISLVEARGKKHLTKAEIQKRKDQEIKVDLNDIKAPDYLSSDLKEEFYDIAGKLQHIGIMTELDEECLARYILSKQNYLMFSRLLQEAISKKNVSEMERMMSLQDRAFKQTRAAAGDLGLTISSRCRLVMPETKDEPKPNKFSKFEKK